jgi:hypothetical protein
MPHAFPPVTRVIALVTFPQLKGNPPIAVNLTYALEFHPFLKWKIPGSSGPSSSDRLTCFFTGPTFSIFTRLFEGKPEVKNL